MVIDKIDNNKIYKGLSGKIAKAFDYINEADLSRIPTGKHVIDGEEIFAIVMEYETKGKNESKYEGHKKYIDLQYIISGNEFIGVSTLTNQTPCEINDENDYMLYELESDLIRFESGMFAIFFPDDLHMPGISINEVSKIKKVVIKIEI